MAKTEEERLQELEAKKNKVNAQIRKIKSEQSKEARNARTKRLIEVGAIMEKSLGIEFNEDKKNNLLCFIETNKEKILLHIISANEMFEKLGYSKKENDKEYLSYEKINDKENPDIDFNVISFNLKDQLINAWSYYCGESDGLLLDVPLIKAINKQMEELKWL